jgi:hypothetical protein
MLEVLIEVTIDCLFLCYIVAEVVIVDCVKDCVKVVVNPTRSGINQLGKINMPKASYFVYRTRQYPYQIIPRHSPPVRETEDPSPDPMREGLERYTDSMSRS